jgi:hypothetical protein
MNVPAQDYVEILDLYSRYNLASDAGDAEGYAGCFAPDGVLILGDEAKAIGHREAFAGDGPYSFDGIRVEGHEELADFKRTEVARRKFANRRHLNGSIALELLPDGSVRGACYLQSFNGHRGEGLIMAQTGVYDDHVVRTPDGWRYATRRLAFD